MPGDRTRFSLDPFKNFFGVLMQQGRVTLDADFNEWVEIVDRQFRVRMLDTVGRCVVPRETETGFQIQVAGGQLTIGPGRAYVHGLLAENHGAEPLFHDVIVEEERGTQAVAYQDQPFLIFEQPGDPPDLPNAGDDGLFPAPTEGGPYLVYLDVWKRDVTHVEDPGLVEKAVGIDTATRGQTVWQVKTLSVPRGTTCATPDGRIPEWAAIIQPPVARLTTAAVGAPASDDPCILGATGGYRGTENRLYRVEIHDPGDENNGPTFKWSRDNASIQTSVIGINAGLDVLTVARIGRDAVRRFAPDDWLEVIDDHLEFTQQPGIMRKVLSVDEVNETITLDVALPANTFNQANPTNRHTRIRRWDQKGQVLDVSNNVIDDVDANGGVILVSAGGGTMVLEDGVQVTWSEDPAGGRYRTGDYWVFAARTVDASVEELEEAPPRGIIHHYCRLAVVTFPDQVDDCRTFWPPDFGEGGGCDCSECVTAESHNSGEFTIQMAIDRVRTAGGKVCLGPGLFNLGNTPVTVSGAQSVHVQGHGWRTILLYNGSGAAINVRGSVGVKLSDFSVAAIAGGDVANLALALQNSAELCVERCLLAQFGFGDRGGPAVGLSGLLIETSLRDNLLFGDTGIVSAATDVDVAGNLTTHVTVAAQRTYTLTLGLAIEDNIILSGRRGISLQGMTVHLGDVHIAKNRFFGSRQVAIMAGGWVASQVLPASSLDILNNSISTQGAGIHFASGNIRVSGNDIGELPRARGEQNPSANGVVLTAGLVDKVTGQVHILGNRLNRMGGDAVRIQAAVETLMIKQNTIANTGGGIVMSDDASAGMVAIENNQLHNINPVEDRQAPVAAIRVFRAQQAAVSGNTIHAFALSAFINPERTGIEADTSRVVRISGNELAQIGPAQEFAGIGTGIAVLHPFDSATVVDNSIRRARALPPENTGPSNWNGIVLSERTRQIESIGGLIATRAWVLPLSADNLDAGYLFASVDNLTIIRRGRRTSANVRGNTIDGYGARFAVLMSLRSAATLADNHCVYAKSPEIDAAVVQMSATSAIASSNHIERIPESDNRAVLSIFAPSERVTVLGNICIGGVILLNNTSLPAPWQPLNIANS